MWAAQRWRANLFWCAVHRRYQYDDQLATCENLARRQLPIEPVALSENLGLVNQDVPADGTDQLWFVLA